MRRPRIMPIFSSPPRIHPIEVEAHRREACVAAEDALNLAAPETVLSGDWHDFCWRSGGDRVSQLVPGPVAALAAWVAANWLGTEEQMCSLRDMAERLEPHLPAGLVPGWRKWRNTLDLFAEPPSPA